MHYKTIQPDNPILRAEITYQQHTIPRWLQWFDRFGVILVAFGISLWLIFHYDSIDNSNVPSLMSSLTFLWIVEFVVVVRSLLAGIGVMWHHQLQSSEAYVITGVRRRQIIVGKFWSALYQIRGWIVAFGFLKVIFVGLLTVNLIIACYRNPLYISINNVISVDKLHYLQTQYYSGIPTSTYDVMVVTGTMILSLLEVMATTAIGLACGIISNKAIGLALAALCRLAPIGVFGLLPLPPSTMIGGFPSVLSPYFRWYMYTWFSLADGGNTAIMRTGLSYHLFFMFDGITQSIVRAFLAAIVMFIAYLVFAFLISNFLLRRQGFLSAASK